MKRLALPANAYDPTPIVEACRQLDYQISPELATAAWLRHSSDAEATWLKFPANTIDLVAIILKYTVEERILPATVLNEEAYFRIRHAVLFDAALAALRLVTPDQDGVTTTAGLDRLIERMQITVNKLNALVLHSTQPPQHRAHRKNQVFGDH